MKHARYYTCSGEVFTSIAEQHRLEWNYLIEQGLKLHLVLFQEAALSSDVPLVGSLSKQYCKWLQLHTAVATLLKIIVREN